jgi:predicted ATP-binding protein involved in virulence
MPPSQEYMYSFFHVNRKLPASTVSSVTNENDILQALNSENFNGKFKQYLVNKKVEQAFALLQDNTLSAKETDRFFGSMNNIFRRIFEDAQLELFFSQKDFEFYFQFSNGQKVIFEHLSDGYSAMLFILLNLLIKTDLIRKSIFDYTINPCGVVLIDEPENHLHLKLQYEIMPLLTTLFPNIQFVIATHSPAVISSIKNATVFDLTSKSTESDRIVGSSFSELMISHFGLENEFSPIADAIFEELNQVIRSIENPQQRKARLQEILQKNEAYLSPSMQLEIESMILNTHQDIS